MKPVKVLIVDDSPFVREFIIELLSEDKEIEIIGQAANGREACEKVLQLKPDIITMDITMPFMDGLQAIERIMSFHAVPILVVTSKADAATAYSAISKGALDVLPKPDLDAKKSQAFIDKIKMLAKVKVIKHIRHVVQKPYFPAVNESKKIIVIASSTGGPKALSILLSGIPENFPCPILVAQHIAEDFISGMIEWLSKVVKLKIKHAQDGELIISGTVYISPFIKHMAVDYQRRIVFKDREPNDIYFPSCNILMSSVADVYGQNTIGVVLTGMGDDGTEGIRKIKTAGGITIAQDEESSIIFGMPKAAIESRCIDFIMPIHKIAEYIDSIVRKQN